MTWDIVMTTKGKIHTTVEADSEEEAIEKGWRKFHADEIDLENHEWETDDCKASKAED